MTDRRKAIAGCLTCAACFFTVAVFVYLLSTAAFTKEIDVSLNDYTRLIAGKLAILLAFSLVVGFSRLVLGGESPSAARRSLHIAVLLVTWVPTFLLLGGSDSAPKTILIGVLIASAILLVGYPLGMLVRKLLDKLFH